MESCGQDKIYNAQHTTIVWCGLWVYGILLKFMNMNYGLKAQCYYVYAVYLPIFVYKYLINLNLLL